MLLFRRLRKEKEEPPAKGGKTPDEVRAPPSPSQTKPESKPVSGPEAAAPVAPASAPPPVPPLSPVVPSPPRLPEKPPAEAVRSRVEGGPFGVCFVCGTVLEGRMCPTCRIAWVE